MHLFFICLISNLFCLEMIGSFDSVKFDSSSPSSGYVLVNQGECPLKHIYISVDVTHGSVSDYIEY